MHPGNSLRYRLQPAQAGPLLGVVIAFALVVFLLPVAVNALTPEREPREEPVMLSSFDSYREIPLELEGQPVECVSNELSPLMWGFDCHEVLIDSIILRGVEDPEHSLRRMVRAGTGGFGAADAPVDAYGESLVLIDESYGLAGMLFPLDDDAFLYVQLDVYLPGAHVATLGEAVWQSVPGAPLPGQLAQDLATLHPSLWSQGQN